MNATFDGSTSARICTMTTIPNCLMIADAARILATWTDLAPGRSESSVPP